MEKLQSGPQLLQQGASPETFKLYERPQTRGYFLGVYIISAACLGYSAVLAHDYLGGGLAVDVPTWARWVFLVPVLFLSGLGTWVFLKAGKHIKLIEVVQGSAGTQLRVTVRPIIPSPFYRRDIINVAPRDVVLECPEPTAAVWVPPTLPTAKISIRDYPQMFFVGSKKIFTNEGIVTTRIEDRYGTFKIDVQGTFDRDLWRVRKLLRFEP